jgi:hypothetical protein
MAAYQQDSVSQEQQVAQIPDPLEVEKERRLKELPKLRPADMIDITSEQLQKIKDIYDSLLEKDRDGVPNVKFFFNLRKDPYIKNI